MNLFFGFDDSHLVVILVLRSVRVMQPTGGLLLPSKLIKVN